MTAPCRRRLRRAGCFSGLDQQPHKGGGQTGGQDSSNDRLQAQGDDLAAAVGRHRPHAVDHDPKTAEIGGAAQRIGYDQTAMVAQRARRQARYRQVAMTSFSTILVPNRAPVVFASAHGMPILADQPGDRQKDDYAEESLNTYRSA